MNLTPWWTSAWSDEPPDLRLESLRLPSYSARTTVALPAQGWSLHALVRALAGRGYPAALPAAAVGHDRRGEERKVLAPLGRLPFACAAIGLDQPRLVLLGEALERESLAAPS
jgi:siroheme synthase